MYNGNEEGNILLNTIVGHPTTETICYWKIFFCWLLTFPLPKSNFIQRDIDLVVISLGKFRADRKIYGHYFDNFQKIPLKYSHVLWPLFWKYAVKNFNSLWKCPLVSYITIGNSNFKPIFRWKSYSKIKLPYLSYGWEENNAFSDTSYSFGLFSLSDMLNHILQYRWVITNLPVCASVVGCNHGSEGEGLSIPHFCVGPNPK